MCFREMLCVCVCVCVCVCERERIEMMQVILIKLGHSWDERVDERGREWMLLLGLCRKDD